MGGRLDDRSRQAAAWASLGAAAAIAALVAGKATRDALFLASHPVAALPGFTAASALLSIAVAFLVARVMPRLTPARLAPALLAGNAALFVAEWVVARASLSAAAALLFVHASVVGAAALSTFWALVSERFGPRAAKRIVGRVGLGGSVGGVLGGLVAYAAPRLASPTGMLLVLASFSGLAAVATRRLGALPLDEPTRAPAEDLPASAGIATLARTPYLRDMATLVGLSALGAGVLDYLVGASAARAHADAGGLLGFFALLHLVTSVGALAAQLFLGRPALERLGLAWCIGIARLAPVLSAVGFFLPAPLGLLVLRAPESVLQSTLYRGGYELLYVPVADETKRATKSIIDLGCDRAGVALGGLAVSVIVPLAADRAELLLLTLAVAAFLACVAVTGRLGSGYVHALELRLKAGALDMDLDGGLDALTRRTLSGSTATLDRGALLAEIERFRARDGAEPGLDRPLVDALAADVATLRAGGPRARELLASRRPLPLTLVAPAIELLADPATRAEARAALRTVASRTTGQLCDALLDRARPDEVRRGAAVVLGTCPGDRAVAGLLGALDDPSQRVREAAALALSRITEGGGATPVPREPVLEAAARELGRGLPALEHVFTLLSVVSDREPLAIAYRTLQNPRGVMRGTAIEYLDNVVPEPVRATLLDVLGEGARSAGARRPSTEVAAELRSGGDDGPVSFRGHRDEP